MIDMAGKQIIPAAVEYAGVLADSANSIKSAGADASALSEMLGSVTKRIGAMQSALAKLKKEEKNASEIRSAKEKAFYYKDVIRPIMDELRAPADELEMIVDKDMWPIPTYGELMFEV